MSFCFKKCRFQYKWLDLGLSRKSNKIMTSNSWAFCRSNFQLQLASCWVWFLQTELVPRRYQVTVYPFSDGFFSKLMINPLYIFTDNYTIQYNTIQYNTIQYYTISLLTCSKLGFSILNQKKTYNTTLLLLRSLTIYLGHLLFRWLQRK